MAEHVFVRALGGSIGITILASSFICIISSYVTVMYAQERTNEVRKADYIMSPPDWDVLFHLVCFSMIALVGAMLMEHTYMFIFIARAAFSPRIPPSIRLTPFFYLILGCYWVFFAIGQASLIVAMKIIRHGTQLPNTFLYACYSMIPIFLSTVPLHVKATRIRLCLSNIILVDRLPQFVVQAEDIEDCIICLDMPETGDAIRNLPCQHTFHKTCVDQWLIKTPSCPLCKRPI